MKFCQPFKKIALLFGAIAGISSAWAAPLFIGYYPDWGKWHKPAYTVEKVPYEKLTHVLWSFITPNTDGSLKGDAADDPSALDSMVTQSHRLARRWWTKRKFCTRCNKRRSARQIHHKPRAVCCRPQPGRA